MEAAETRCLAISTATVGRAAERTDLAISLFDEGHLVYLAKGGDTLQDFLHRRFPQEAHALRVGGFLDFGGRPARQDHLTDGIGQVEELADGHAPSEARAAALDAPRSLVKRMPVGQAGVHR